MEVETETDNGLFRLVNIRSALLFETPEQLYARVFREIRPRTKVPEIQVEFRQFANANSSIRLDNGRITVKIADLLEGAPAPVAEALANILISKLFRKPIAGAYQHRYRLWLNRKDVRRAIHLVRQIRGRKQALNPQGIHYNLDEIFDKINREFFDGLLARPALGWSTKASRTLLGHYDPSHNAIVLSRLLDGENVPASIVDYVMFHEMLHLRHPEEHQGSKRRIHTAEFRAAERRYPRLKEAKLALKALLSCPG